MSVAEKISSLRTLSAMRRFANAKKSAMSIKMEFDYMIMEKVPPLTLFDFSRDDDVKDFNNKEWREGDDRDIGGLSESSAKLIHSDTDVHKRFLRWSGVVNNALPEGSKVVRSGYCAIQSPVFAFGGINLDEWDGIHLRCRLGIPRSYMFNLKAESFFPDDIYHGFFPRKNPSIHPLKPTTESPDGWTDVILPFKSFLVSSRGRMKEIPLELDTVKLEHVGFTMADGVNGKFQLDIASISAVCLGDEYDEI